MRDKIATQFILLATLVGGLLLSPCVYGEDSRPSEYAVKAALLVNILKFVTLSGDPSPIRICIPRKAGVVEAFEDIEGESVENRVISLLFYERTPLPAGSCEVYFFPEGENVTIPSSERRGVITVGESEKFLASGGLVSFYTENSRIRFEINLEAAEEAEVKFSSKLLNLAKIYKGDLGD